MLAYADKSSLIPENKILFSATDLNLYFDASYLFFRDKILKEREFKNYESTALGTLVHYNISQQHLEQPIDSKEVEDFLNSVRDTVNIQWVRDKYIEMTVPVREYINGESLNKPDDIEKNYIYQLTENVYVGGTLDCRYGDTIIDYKTTSNKSIKSEQPLDFKYKNQLLVYAWLCLKHGIEVNAIQNTYITIPETNRFSDTTGRRLQDYPTRIIPIKEYLRPEDIETIESKLYLIAESIEYVLKHKDSLYLFAKDRRLKERTF